MKILKILAKCDRSQVFLSFKSSLLSLVGWLDLDCLLRIKSERNIEHITAWKLSLVFIFIFG